MGTEIKICICGRGTAICCPRHPNGNVLLDLGSDIKEYHSMSEVVRDNTSGPLTDVPIVTEIIRAGVENLGPIHKDEGKEMLSIIPYPAMKLAAEIFTYGLQKYAEYNYKNPPGLTTKQLINSCMRHVWKYNNGEDLDPESGLSHLGHAMANLMMIIDLHANGMGGEDYRWKK